MHHNIYSFISVGSIFGGGSFGQLPSPFCMLSRREAAAATTPTRMCTRAQPDSMRPFVCVLRLKERQRENILYNKHRFLNAFPSCFVLHLSVPEVDFNLRCKIDLRRLLTDNHRAKRANRREEAKQKKTVHPLSTTKGPGILWHSSRVVEVYMSMCGEAAAAA